MLTGAAAVTETVKNRTSGDLHSHGPPGPAFRLAGPGSQ